jgi:hypothetical protein
VNWTAPFYTYSYFAVKLSHMKYQQHLSSLPEVRTMLCPNEQYGYCAVQGVFYSNKISGISTNFGLLVHVLPGPNKQRALKKSMLLS